ncbi:MAG TPA: carboxypeptidase regulatory-like domain-containing protein [Pyrinomonadaceae bacterium]|nr:carboxypeptidase regulatory-like domain-containing protein [Pyrinomonadaceae bacterium]
MKSPTSVLLSFLCAALLLVALPFGAGASSAVAGGELSGTVTDPKGAVVVGASVAVLDAATGQQRAEVKTDARGKFKVEGLPAGSYVVVVTAPNFSESRREGVAVEEGKAATLDFRLEVGQLEGGTVDVKATGLKPNADPLYQTMRGHEFAGGPVFAVNGLQLKRDAAVFALSGEVYFMPPVEGRHVGAVFIGTGELKLTPPTEAERRGIAIFTGQPTLAETFSHLVMRFTDKTFDEIKSSPQAQAASGAQAARARELYEEAMARTRKRAPTVGSSMTLYNYDMRTLVDLYAPQRPGFFLAFVNGSRFNKLLFRLDPLGVGDLAPEEVALASYGESDWGIWTSFHREEEYAKGTASSDQDNRLYDIAHHEIDGAIKGTQIAASDTITLRALQPHVRVIPFDLFRTLRVSRVRDEAGQDLNFIQESKDNDADFAIVFPEALPVGKPQKITVEYQGGDAVADSGGGNYILIPRSTWYPNNPQTTFGDRATFSLTFRYPKGHMLVGVGAPTEAETREGDITVTKWSSGQTELAVAGFNYGRFKRKALKDADSGYEIEFYANTEVPDSLKRVQMAIEQAEAAGQQTMTTLGSITTTKMADSAIADAQNATRLYNAYFGKLPYTRLAMTQQPAANFGQAWPTLVYMPFTAFLDTTQRTQLFGVQGGTDNFWKYVGPHEVAHQWWGHIIGWKSYRDQWMSEGFAEFSTSLYAFYIRKDINKFIDFWEEQRQQIVTAKPSTRGNKPYTVGAVTQGWRLSNGKTGATYQNLVYPKGAYILHMLRMMMWDNKAGDEQFRKMMQDFVQTHYNKDVSTEDFKRAVEKHMTPTMNIGGNGKMDWFFDQWVYGTQMPSYRFEYQLNGDTLSGRITQSGVSDDFLMLVPVYVDLGNGWAQLGRAPMKGNSTVELGNIKLPSNIKKASLAALKDVLAAEVVNVKK